MHRSENDLVIAMENNQQQKMNSDDDNDDTLTLCENEADLQLSKQKPINNDQQQEDDDKIAWPPQRPSPIPSTQKNGIKKFVRNGFKLFISQPQQHKRTGK